MTVMVTGASGPIGHALIPLLRVKDEVRACVRRPASADPLRALGAKVAIGRLDDAGALAEVLQGVYTLIHLVGGPNQPDEDAVLAANHGSVMTAISAAREAGVTRFVLSSACGASVDAPHPYLRAKGLAEEAVANSGLDHAIVRSAHAYGLGGLWFTAMVQGALASPPFLVGDGLQEVAPVFADDVASVLAAADDQPSRLEGTWGLEGPDAISVEAFVGMLGDSGSGVEPLRPADAAARLSAAVGVPIATSAVELFAMPCRADAPDAAAAFGVARTPLVEGLRRTMQRAATAHR